MKFRSCTLCLFFQTDTLSYSSDVLCQFSAAMSILFCVTHYIRISKTILFNLQEKHREKKSQPNQWNCFIFSTNLVFHMDQHEFNMTHILLNIRLSIERLHQHEHGTSNLFILPNFSLYVEYFNLFVLPPLLLMCHTTIYSDHYQCLSR